MLHACNAPHDNPLDPESPFYANSEDVKAELGGRVRSLHTARLFPTIDSYAALVEAWAPPDMSMESVWVSFDYREPLALRRASQDTSDLQVWKTSLVPSYLSAGTGINDPQMQAVAGKPFFIGFMTQNGDEIELDPVYMFRVILETPQLVTPQGRDTTFVTPVLEWESFHAPFEFQYLATVWRNEAEFEVQIWNSDSLTPDTSQVMVDIPLPTGNYYWTLFVIDTYGNYSRSKEGEFYARPETLP